MKSRIIAVAIIRKGNEILIGKKPENTGPYPNTWHLPGGGIDLEKESCDEALAREVLEETGLKIKNICRIAWDTDIENNKKNEPTYYIFLQFSCDFAGGKLKAGDDMKHFEWAEIKNLPKYRINKPTKILLSKLGLI